MFGSKGGIIWRFLTQSAEGGWAGKKKGRGVANPALTIYWDSGILLFFFIQSFRIDKAVGLRT